MKMRQGESQDMGISVRMSRDEWEKVKVDGDNVFIGRSVGYMNVVPTRILFETISPYYKDKMVLDEQDMERSVEELAVNKKVEEEIRLKVK